MRSGIVRGSEIRSNRGSVRSPVLMQVQISDPKDVQTVELMTHAGLDINPPDGSVVVIDQVGPAWKIGVSTSDEITPQSDPGETELYSSSGGSKLARIKCHDTGLVSVSNSAESLHQLLSDLITAINAIVTSDGATISVGSQTALTAVQTRILTLLGSV